MTPYRLPVAGFRPSHACWLLRAVPGAAQFRPPGQAARVSAVGRIPRPSRQRQSGRRIPHFHRLRPRAKPLRLAAFSAIPPVAVWRHTRLGGGFSAARRGGFGAAPAPALNPVRPKLCMTFRRFREDVEKSGLIRTASGSQGAARECVRCSRTSQPRRASWSPSSRPTRSSAVYAEDHHAGEDEPRQDDGIRNNVCSTLPRLPLWNDAQRCAWRADHRRRHLAKLPGRGTFDTLTGNALQK